MKKTIQLNEDYKFLNPDGNGWSIGIVYQIYANNIIGILCDNKRYGVHTSALRDVDEKD